MSRTNAALALRIAKKIEQTFSDLSNGDTLFSFYMEGDIENTIMGLCVPDGWSVVGCGGYRIAILGPDGFVYKINYDKTEPGNEMELNTYRYITQKYDLSGETAIPVETKGIVIDGELVIQQPFVDGPADYDSIPDWIRNEALSDVIGQNAVVDGITYFYDLQF